MSTVPYYPKEERETLLLFDEVQMQWRIHSTSPKHIDRLMEVAEITHARSDDNGTVIQVDGYLAPSQVRLYDVPSEKQKEHMAAMRARRLNE